MEQRLHIQVQGRSDYDLNKLFADGWTVKSTITLPGHTSSGANIHCANTLRGEVHFLLERSL